MAGKARADADDFLWGILVPLPFSGDVHCSHMAMQQEYPHASASIGGYRHRILSPSRSSARHGTCHFILQHAMFMLGSNLIAKLNKGRSLQASCAAKPLRFNSCEGTTGKGFSAQATFRTRFFAYRRYMRL